MWEWITANAKVLTLVTTAFTLVVWTVYGQLMAANDKRKRKPRLFVKQGSGHGLDSVCLVSNMSAEAIYIRCVLVSLRVGEQTYRDTIADADKPTNLDAEADPDQNPCQGPLKASETMNLGTFRSLVAQIGEAEGLDVDHDARLPIADLNSVTVTVVTAFGPEESTVGARRHFVVENHDQEPPMLHAEGAFTESLVGRRKVRPLKEALARFTEDRY
jgi:hypothetical protein